MKKPRKPVVPKTQLDAAISVLESVLVLIPPEVERDYRVQLARGLIAAHKAQK